MAPSIVCFLGRELGTTTLRSWKTLLGFDDWRIWGFTLRFASWGWHGGYGGGTPGTWAGMPGAGRLDGMEDWVGHWVVAALP